MSDKVEIRLDREYLERPVNEFVKVINENVKRKYPGYSLAWLEANVEKDVIEEEIKEIGATHAKVVELDVNLLPFRHYGVIVPEGQELLSVPA